MTSNFALSLSFEGIKLLHRVPEGWELVGETALDVPDLTGALAQMRADALLLEPDGLRTKLIIPTEQIKYLTLETAQTELGDVMAALDGATPYAVDELVVDFDRNGGRTYIAAVARETLEEARGFAAEHDFNPVCFAAVPELYTFQGEVFFGPVSGANGAQTDRDPAPVRQTGVAVLPSTGEPDTSDAPPPLFTSRAKPASAAAVVPPPTNTTELKELPEAPADAEVSFSRAKPIEPAAPKVPEAAPASEPTPTPVIATPAPAPAAEAKADSAPLSAPPRAEEVASSGGFISRRKGKAAGQKTDKKANKKAAAIATKQAAPVRQKPRFLGLILTVILLIFMAIVAIWASTLTEEELSGWFGFAPSSDIIAVEDPPIPQVVAAAPQAEAPVVAADPETPLEAAPAEQASPTPTVRLTASGRILSPAEANRIYAATGVWQRAPRFPLEPRDATLQATLPAAFAMPADPAPMELPSLALMQPDLPILPPINPPAPGTDFARDENGFILATPQGALTPSGAIVFAAAPPKKPPLRARATTPLVEAPEGVVLVTGRPSKIPPRRPVFEPAPQEAPTEPALAALQPQEDYTRRPKTRPSGLVPAVIANADPELAAKRPKLRPNGLAPAATPEPAAPATPDITDVVGAIAAAAPASPYQDMTANAVRNSSRPDTRPRNFARVVARAREAEAARAASRAATQPQTASAAPARASGPVPTTVARAATLDNAIRLRDINLIGVYGRPNDRRALVRLGNGRYVKVQVGSRLDGGRVAAIGDSELRYVKRGRSEVLKLPD